MLEVASEEAATPHGEVVAGGPWIRERDEDGAAEHTIAKMNPVQGEQKLAWVSIDITLWRASVDRKNGMNIDSTCYRSHGCR